MDQSPRCQSLGLSLEAGKDLDLTFPDDRGVWLQVVNGSAHVAGIDLQTGDGLRMDRCEAMHIAATETSELLIFDLPTPVS